MAISKKSIIFVQSFWNLVNMIASWGNYFHQVSWGQEQDVYFLLMANFWMCLIFFDPDFNIAINLTSSSKPSLIGIHSMILTIKANSFVTFWWHCCFDCVLGCLMTGLDIHLQGFYATFFCDAKLIKLLGVQLKWLYFIPTPFPGIIYPSGYF